MVYLAGPHRQSSSLMLVLLLLTSELTSPGAAFLPTKHSVVIYTRVPPGPGGKWEPACTGTAVHRGDDDGDRKVKGCATMKTIFLWQITYAASNAFVV